MKPRASAPSGGAGGTQGEYGPAWKEELALLFEALPPRVALAAQAAAADRGDLLEVVLDLGLSLIHI